jgi:RES domain
VSRRRSRCGTRIFAPPPTPVPPFPPDADPLIGVWPAGKDIVRVYDALYSPRGFWTGTPTRPGRFHPFTPTGAPGPVPVLYGSDRLAGAISETVFHDVPVRGTKHVPRATLRRKLAITLTATRDLRLADLTGYGLRRLGATRAEIIDSDPRSYPHTASWAHGLHAHREHLDGIQWVSRQYDTALALILFGDRVQETELDIAPSAIPMPLALGLGFDNVQDLADQADITIT